MNRRTLLIGLALILSVPSSSHGAKAYDIVEYVVKIAGRTIYFEFADGYSEASTMKVSDAASGKVTNFQMDNSGADAMTFVPVKKGGAIKSISVKIDSESAAPAKVAGTYVAGGKSVSFTLTKSKQGK
jgi:hypothetical protein